MEAGPLRHRFGVYAPTTAADAGGTLVETFPGSADSTIWADIDWGGGDEKQQAGRTDASRTCMLTTRYNSTLDEKSRLKFGSRWFKITRLEIVGERNREHHIYCTEVMT